MTSSVPSKKANVSTDLHSTPPSVNVPNALPLGQEKPATLARDHRTAARMAVFSTHTRVFVNSVILDMAARTVMNAIPPKNVLTKV
jgi:hypothetical protein